MIEMSLEDQHRIVFQDVVADTKAAGLQPHRHSLMVSTIKASAQGQTVVAPLRIH
jgi:hypothetical protein